MEEGEGTYGRRERGHTRGGSGDIREEGEGTYGRREWGHTGEGSADIREEGEGTYGRREWGHTGGGRGDIREEGEGTYGRRERGHTGGGRGDIREEGEGTYGRRERGHTGGECGKQIFVSIFLNPFNIFKNQFDLHFVSRVVKPHSFRRSSYLRSLGSGIILFSSVVGQAYILLTIWSPNLYSEYSK